MADAARMRRNLRLLPWWWVLRWPAFGEALWVIYLIEERGFSLGQVFVLHALFVMIALAAEVPTGAFADRYGRRPALILSTALTGVGFLAFGLSEAIPLLILAWTALALADAFMSGADNALLYDTMDALGRRDDFARALGRLGAIQNAALAAIVIAGAAIASATSLAVPFVLAGLATLPAVALAWMLTEPPRAEGAGEGTEAQRSFLDTALGALRHAVRVRSIATMILVFAVLTIAFELMGLTLQPVARDYELPLWTLGWFGSVAMLTNAAGAWASDALGARLGLARLTAGAVLLGALALAAGAIGTIALFPIFAMTAFAWSALQPHVAGYLSRRTEASQRATVLSLMSFVPGLFGIGAALAVAPLIDEAGLAATLLGGASLLALLGVAAVAAWANTGDTASEPLAEQRAD